MCASPFFRIADFTNIFYPLLPLNVDLPEHAVNLKYFYFGLSLGNSFVLVISLFLWNNILTKNNLKESVYLAHDSRSLEPVGKERKTEREEEGEVGEEDGDVR